MDRPRGRAAGGRARGNTQEDLRRGAPHQQQQKWPPQQQVWGPPPQLAWGSPLQHPEGPPRQRQQGPPQQSSWKANGRGNGSAAPPPQQQQQLAVTQQMGKMVLSDGGVAASSQAVSRGGGDSVPTRGAMRQRHIDDTHVFRSSQLSSKQGTKGKQVTMQANYFKFLKRTDVTLYQYRVDFNPDVELTYVRKAILRHHKDTFGKAYIFDGTVLFTMERLKEGLELTSKNAKDDSIVKILIKMTTDLHAGDAHYIMLLNQILRSCLDKMDLQLVRRDYFDANAKIELPQHKLEIWPGYLTSIRQHETDMMLNCDLSSKVLRHESAYDFLMNCRQRSQDWKGVFQAAMIGSIVITNYNNKTYRVDDVDWESTPNSTFDMKGKQVSYKDYFLEKYQLRIRANDQPVLVSKPKAKDIRGGRGDNIICLIPEITFLTGIDDSMRTNFNLMKAIDEHTRVAPHMRIQRLEQGFMTRLTNTKACQETLSLWNMAFEPRLVSFPGRILDPQNIIVGENVQIPCDPLSGDFTRPLTQKRCSLLDPGKLEAWAVVYPQKLNQRDVWNFCQALSKACQTLGFHIPEPTFEKINDDRSGSYVNCLEMLIGRGGYTLIMTVVPNVRADRYEAIKKKCYIQRTVPNQVVLAKNLANKNLMSVATKIGIQMSCKIGGSPWTVAIPFKGPTMIIGFDVCHDTQTKRSVGAFVASLNAQHTRYYSSVCHHACGNELSSHMYSEMLKAVAHYRQANNGVIPERIFFFRDGVGEGNLHYVLETEIKEICKQWKATFGVECPLTFIVVSKRINTKIFYKGGNPPPGTVVDDVITLPTMYDFFLVSQSVRQGTVGPTAYNVIYDQQNVRPDVLQQLSYKLTHMYFNWSGTIRVPAPCQYAHKLAAMVGQHLHACPTGMPDILYFL